MREVLVVVAVLFLTSCGGSSDNVHTPMTVSTGLKIFVTASKHVGDFKNDPLLQGINAISKADDFCNKDANKPNNSIYKALIVDGTNRDAVNNLDWVLKPITTYYRSYGDIEIGKTTSNSILPVLYADLTNSISASLPDYSSNFVWTGIGNASNFSNMYTTEVYDCGKWSIGDNSSSGTVGKSDDKGAYSMTSAGSSSGCPAKLSLYCVEQP